MISDEAGAPTDSTNTNTAADEDTTAANKTRPGDRRQDEPEATSNQEPQEGDQSASLVEQSKTKARGLSRRVGVVIPKERKSRVGALTAVATATAGLAVGWVVRRGRRRRLPWSRRGR